MYRPKREIASTVPPQEKTRARAFSGDQAFLFIVVVLPFLIIGTLMLYPLVYSLWNSFFERSFFRMQEVFFTGLENYTYALTSSRFWNSVRITAIFTFATTLLSVGLGLWVAVLLNTRVGDRSVRLRGLFRSMILIPFILSQAVVGAIFVAYFWNPNSGLITLFVENLGFSAPNWLSNSSTALWAITITDAWLGFSLAAVLLEAAIRIVPRSLYDAANIDGASNFAAFWHITLPLIIPQLLIVILLRITGAWRMFDLVFIMTEGGPGRSTQTLSLFIYNTFMSFGEFGYASALSWIMIVQLALICGTIILIFGRRGVAYAEDK
jgi:multiple sugar transport system permease protein